MTQPRHDTRADAPQVDRVRDAMRYHDERQEHDDNSTEHKPENTPEGDERKREHAEESEEA